MSREPTIKRLDVYRRQLKLRGVVSWCGAYRINLWGEECSIPLGTSQLSARSVMRQIARERYQYPGRKQ